jgi:hypothetical protein
MNITWQQVKKSSPFFLLLFHAIEDERKREYNEMCEKNYGIHNTLDVN